MHVLLIQVAVMHSTCIVFGMYRMQYLGMDEDKVCLISIALETVSC